MLLLLAAIPPALACACCEGPGWYEPIGWSEDGTGLLVHHVEQRCLSAWSQAEVWKVGEKVPAVCTDLIAPGLPALPDCARGVPREDTLPRTNADGDIPAGLEVLAREFQGPIQTVSGKSRVEIENLANHAEVDLQVLTEGVWASVDHRQVDLWATPERVEVEVPPEFLLAVSPGGSLAVFVVPGPDGGWRSYGPPVVFALPPTSGP